MSILFRTSMPRGLRQFQSPATPPNATGPASDRLAPSNAFLARCERRQNRGYGPKYTVRPSMPVCGVQFRRNSLSSTWCSPTSVPASMSEIGGFHRSRPEKLAIRFQDGYIVGYRANWKLPRKPAPFTDIRAVDNGDEYLRLPVLELRPNRGCTGFV